MNTEVEYLDGDAVVHTSPAISGKGKGVPAVVTKLAVGCRRKIVLYSWKDVEPQEPQVRSRLPNASYVVEWA